MTAPRAAHKNLLLYKYLPAAAYKNEEPIKSSPQHSHKKYRRTFREKRGAGAEAINSGLPELMQGQPCSELVAGAGFEPTTSGL